MLLKETNLYYYTIRLHIYAIIMGNIYKYRSDTKIICFICNNEKLYAQLRIHQKNYTGLLSEKGPFQHKNFTF